jgi:hypothetical protein
MEIIPVGEIQEFLFDSSDPSRNMERIQTVLAFLLKPGHDRQQAPRFLPVSI